MSVVVERGENRPSAMLALAGVNADLCAHVDDAMRVLGLRVHALAEGRRISRANLADYQLIVFGWHERLLRARWLCSGLRQRAKSAVLVSVSAMSDERTHLQALQAGADEFLTRDQSAELVAERIRVLMRRAPHHENTTRAASACGSSSCADVAVKFASLKECPTDLTRVQERIFDVLAAARSPVSTAELISRAWPGQRVFEHTVHTHISLLRQRLFGSGLRLVNERGRGYLLEREPSCRAPAPDSAKR